MNVAIKLAVAAATVAASSSAFAYVGPASSASDMVLIVEKFAGTSLAGTYVLDTGVTVSSMFDSSVPTLLDQSLNTTNAHVANKTINASSTLTSFLGTAGDTYQWGLFGMTSTANNGFSDLPGNNYATFTTKQTAATVAGMAISVFSTAFSNAQAAGTGALGLAGGLQTYLTGTETTGFTANKLTLANFGLNNTNSTLDYQALGAKVSLYGLTGNNDLAGTSVNYATVNSYVLGNVSLDAQGNLTLGSGTVTPPPAVPVPGAVWLLASGLLGLVGVSRRRAV